MYVYEYVYYGFGFMYDHTVLYYCTYHILYFILICFNLVLRYYANVVASIRGVGINIINISIISILVDCKFVFSKKKKRVDLWKKIFTTNMNF